MLTDTPWSVDSAGEVEEGQPRLDEGVGHLQLDEGVEKRGPQEELQWK